MSTEIGVKDMIDLSIIIPTYNQEKYICDCLDSIIFKQRNINYEIIIVDDGSTDLTSKIIESYKRFHNDKIKILRSNRLGAGACRNLGISVARGKYLHFLDSDDFLEEDAYEKSLKCIEKSNADICLFNHYRYDNNTKIKSERVYTDLPKDESIFTFCEFSESLINSHTNVVPWNKIYRREYIQKNNFKFDEIMCANDRTFYFSTIIACDKIVLCNKTLINYRVNNLLSLTGSGRNKNFSNHIDAFKNSRKFISTLGESVQKRFLDCTMNDMAFFYEKLSAYEKERNSAKIREFVKIIDDDIYKLNMSTNKTSWKNSLDNMRRISEYSELDVPIVLCCDDNYAPYAGVAIQSIIENS